MKISDDIEADLWTKLVVNCAYNAISALGDAPYSRMVATPEVRDLMLDAVKEVAAVAKAKGIRLPDDILDAAMKPADAMPQTKSSTAQDIAKGRPTEIEHLNGYVVREGEALGVATPVNRTLNALIKLLEQKIAAETGLTIPVGALEVSDAKSASSASASVPRRYHRTAVVKIVWRAKPAHARNGGLALLQRHEIAIGAAATKAAAAVHRTPAIGIGLCALRERHCTEDQHRQKYSVHGTLHV